MPPVLGLPPVLELPPAPVPPVPTGGGGGVQLPTVEPGMRSHRPPGQQSPLIVHAPAIGTHLAAPQWSAPLASGTHGRLSQQSAASAQVSPAL
jgi:hypothetical protein